MNEKKRRVCLREAYEELRLALPQNGEKKIPKLLILNQGKELLRQLQAEEVRLKRVERKERDRRDRLEAKFEQLKRELGLVI